MGKYMAALKIEIMYGIDVLFPEWAIVRALKYARSSRHANYEKMRIIVRSLRRNENRAIYSTYLYGFPVKEGEDQ
jgi:hypothetical protein